MTDLFLPLVSYLLTVGRTINVVNYEFGWGNEPIYNDETDIVESPFNSTFNASYHVLPDNEIPYEYMRIPVDLLLRLKYEGVTSAKRNLLRGYWQTTKDPDQALILVVAEKKTSEKTVKEGINATPSWQDHIRDRDHQTHYADKIVYGGQVISFISVRSIVKGDVQIFRRILKDTMGTSGVVNANTIELWKKAEKAIRESPDIRGEVFMDHRTECFNGRPLEEWKIENLFEYVSKFSEFVEITHDEIYSRNPLRMKLRPPLYVSFKPLHDLDERYPEVQKDVVGEKYLAKLHYLLQDVEKAKKEFMYVQRGLTEENIEKYHDFWMMLQNITSTLLNVFDNNLSAYEKVDKAALLEAFEQYQQGLDGTTKNYLTLFRKLREKIVTGITCGSDFFTPTSGALSVEDDEVLSKGAALSMEICQNFCTEDERCRAFGYSDTECLIYYRSTNSATINVPGGDGMKIYDRKCRFRYYDDEW